MSSSNGCRKSFASYTGGSFKEKLTGRTTATEVHHLSQGLSSISVGASQHGGWGVDTENCKEAESVNSRPLTLGSSTSNAWARPDKSQRLGLERANPPSTLQMGDAVRGYVGDGDEDDEDEDLCYDDDDDLLSDDDDDFDLDGANMSCITRNHKMLRVFFNMENKLSTEEINDPVRNYHCPVCQGGPGAIDWYRGLQPLLLHAKTKGSKRVKLHRKFANVLVEEFQERGICLLPPADLVGQWEGPKQNVKDEPIVWPPMVIVMNTLLEKDDNDKWHVMGSEELLLSFGDYGAYKAKNAYGPQGHRGMSVLVFESSAKGYIEAQRLDEHFLKQGRGRIAWALGPVLFGPGGKRRLFGFMAVKEDLDIFNQHCHGKFRLKFDLRSYEEVVVKQIAQMSEDNELLIWYQQRAATAEMLAKANEESFNVASQKLRRTLEDTRKVTERSKEQLQENKEEMDYQAEFFGERFKEMHEVTAPRVSDLNKIQEEINKEKTELFNSQSPDMVDRRQRVNEMIHSLQLKMQDVQTSDAEKVELMKTCQDCQAKMNEAERAFQEAKMKIEKEFDAALGMLLKTYTAHYSEGSASIRA